MERRCVEFCQLAVSNANKVGQTGTINLTAAIADSGRNGPAFTIGRKGELQKVLSDQMRRLAAGRSRE